MFRKARFVEKKHLTREEIIKQKLHKEPLTSDDIITLLFLSKDKFKPWIDRLCELYPEIDKNLFKEGNVFKFPPYLHSVFLVLFGNIDSHPDFIRSAGTARPHRWDEYINYYKKQKESMQEFMPEEEIYEIKYKYPYIRSELEELLANAIKENFNSISVLIQKMPDDLKFQVLASINNTMEQLILSLSTEQANYDNVNKWDGKDINETLKHEMEMQYTSFDNMLAVHLKWLLEHKNEMQEKVDKEADIQDDRNDLDSIYRKYDSKKEQYIVDALFDRLAIEPWRNMLDNDIKRNVSIVRNAVLSEPSNKEVIKKVMQALEGIDQGKAKVILKTMEKALISLELAEKNNEAFRAEAKKFLDKMYYDAVKEINYNS